MIDYQEEMDRRVAFGRAGDNWQNDRHPSARGWRVNYPIADEQFWIFWEGCLHVCRRVLEENQNSPTVPEGLLLASVEGARPAHYMNEGTMVVLIEAHRYFGKRYLHIHEWEELPMAWRVQLLEANPVVIAPPPPPYCWRHRPTVTEQPALPVQPVVPVVV